MFVKVCGLSTTESVEAAVAAGADALGFVLTSSPREVSTDTARTLLDVVPPEVAAVGVFRDEPIEDALAAVKEAGLDWIQLHGNRSTRDVAAAHEAKLRVIRAVTMADDDAAFASMGEDILLVDSAVPGSGESWDYSSVRDRIGDNNENHDGVARRWLLAGGLHADNVAHAAHAAHAWGVDVSSGVESSRGIKDVERIRDFVHAAKG